MIKQITKEINSVLEQREYLYESGYADCKIYTYLHKKHKVLLKFRKKLIKLETFRQKINNYNEF